VSNQQFKQLETKMDDLIFLLQQLKQENQLLRDKTNEWQQERDTLITNNEQARIRLESVLRRLQNLQEGSQNNQHQNIGY
jgi:cell division protein ZapB